MPWLKTRDIRQGVVTADKLSSDAVTTAKIADASISRAKLDAAVSDLLPKKATATISAAQVATLNATPVEVVAAPGAGKFIVVDMVHVFLDYESAAYDGSAAGEDLTFKYTDGSGAQVVAGVIDQAGFADATSDQHRVVRGLGTEVVPVENAPIVAHILTGEWFSAAGDSPLKVEVRYYEVDFTL